MNATMNLRDIQCDIRRLRQAGQSTSLDSVNTKETIELADLEPNGAVVGGPFTGTITLTNDATIGATPLAVPVSAVLPAAAGRPR